MDWKTNWSEEGERGDRARVARAIGALRGPRRDSARVVRNGRGRVSYRRRRHRGKAPRGVAAGVARRRSSRRRAQSARPSRRRGGVDVTARTLTISRGWMMQVAPMPDKPPFMNGLTAFQVALSFRDMTMRSCGACGDVLRADLGADAFSFATERLSPEPAAAGDFAISVVRHEFRVRIFWQSLASRGDSRVINPRRIEKRKTRVFLSTPRDRDARDFAKPSRKRSLASRCSCDDRSPPARATHSEARRVGQSGRALSRWHGRALGHTSRALGSTRRCTRRSRHREEGRTRATLDSVDRHP